MPLQSAENALKAVFCASTDVGTLFRNNGHGSDSEVLWSSVCRCGFKVKGLDCQMLYSRRSTSDFAFDSSFLTPFKGRRTRSVGQGGLSTSKYARIRVPSYVRAHSWDALPPFYSARHRATGSSDGRF